MAYCQSLLLYGSADTYETVRAPCWKICRRCVVSMRKAANFCCCSIRRLPKESI
ncbi:MAG: hypothetical protein ACLUI3_03675 [Christensenellales bacterium]